MSFLLSLDALVLGLFGRVTSWIQSKIGWNTFDVAKVFLGLIVVTTGICAWYEPFTLVSDLLLLILLVSEIRGGVRKTVYNGDGYRLNPHRGEPIRMMLRCIWLMITFIALMSVVRSPDVAPGVGQFESVMHAVRMTLLTCVLYLSAGTPEPCAYVIRHTFRD